MNKVKFIVALFAASAGLLLAAAPKFSIKITPVKTVYKLGEKIEFDLEVTHPENYLLKAWQPTISKLGSPAGFEQKWNQWGSINLDPVHWIPKAAAEKKSIRCGFIPGKNFIPGDYNFGIVVRLYPDGNTAKNPKLLSGRLNITLEAPASAADEKMIIDGKADEKCWQNSAFVSDFKMLGSEEKAAIQTRYKTFCNGKNLYFYVECDEPEMAHLSQVPLTDGHSGIWLNDSIEIKLACDESLQYFYKIIVDCNGKYNGKRYVDNNVGGKSYSSPGKWDAMMKTAARREKNKWILEIAFPLGVMDIDSKTNSNWRLDIGRNRYAGAKKAGKAATFSSSELSSGSVYTKLDHSMVWEYPAYQVKNFSADRFLYNLESMRNTISKADNGDLVCTTRANLFSTSENGSCFTVKTYFSDAQGNIKGQSEKLLGIPGKTNMPVTFTTSCKEPGKYNYYIEFWSNESEPVLLKRYTSTVEMYYSPFKAVLKRPAYRNNIYATMPDKNIEVQISANQSAGKLITAELLDNAGKVVLQKQITADPTGNKVIFDAAKLPDGRYDLQISMTENGHNFKENIKIRKLPYREGEVWLDASGACFVDGKPFLPIGWYIVEPGITLGKEENSYVHPSMKSSDFADYKMIMDTLWASKRKGILNPYHQMDGKRTTDKNYTFATERQTRAMTKEQIELLTRNITEMGKHPGVLAYYMADEPEASVKTPEWLAQAKEVIEEADPYHPCVVTNFSNEGMIKFAGSCDILFPDCYPGYYEKIHTKRPMDTTLRGKTAKQIGKPWWIMLPGTLFPKALSSDPSIKGIPPSYQDLRHQIIEAALENAKGFSFYAPMDGLRYSSLIVGIPVLCDQLGALKNYIIKDTIEVKSAVTPAETMFFTGMKKDGKEFCVMSANATFKELKIEYTLPNKFNGTLYNAGATRSFTVKDGKFTDTIRGRHTRIYMTDRKLAESMEDSDSVEQRIAQHLNDRKKKGNHLAIGEMLLMDQITYHTQPEKRPAHIPGIKASSQYGNYYNMSYTKVGALYCTLDGIRNPTRHEFCWAPYPGDKAPYIAYTLPQAAAVKEARIYTPLGNLRKGVIVTDSKRYNFVNDSKKEEIIIPLDGEVTTTMKIEVTEYVTTPYDQMLGTNSCRGVIAEVELY